VIDGIVGAEGLTPGPVDPVDMRMIVASNHSVEADRITTEMMGFDPSTNKLIVEAVQRGFGDPKVEIIGKKKIVAFRPADKSLIGERFHKHFPNVKMLVGITKNNPLILTDISQVTPEKVRQMELACDGGCLPCMAQVFEMYLYASKPVDTSFPLAILYGQPAVINGKGYYFDAEGKAYDEEAIKALPMKKYAIGECARSMEDKVEHFTGGCCDISASTFKLGGITGIPLPQLSLANKGLMGMAGSMLETFRIKRGWIKKGEHVDVVYNQKDFDKVFPIPALTPEQMKQNYIEWPFPRMTKEEIRQSLKELKVL
jgi:hypothetical protein